MGIFTLATGLVTGLLKLILPGHFLDWIPGAVDGAVQVVTKIADALV
jgi:hypothetical protein